MKYKKTVTAILLMIILCSFFTFPSSADESFTAEEAVEIFNGANALNCLIFRGECEYLDVDVYFEYDRNDVGLENGGLSHCRLTKYSYNNKDYNILSEDDLLSIIGMYFEDSDAYFKFVQDYSGENASPYRKPFYTTAEGHVYHVGVIGSGWKSYRTIGISDISVNGNTATIDLDLRLGLNLVYYYLKVPVEFVKTEEGWRLSNSSFEMLYSLDDWRKYVYDSVDLAESPDTSDHTSILIVTIALAAVITPFALSKKRRGR